MHTINCLKWIIICFTNQHNHGLFFPLTFVGVSMNTITINNQHGKLHNVTSDKTSLHQFCRQMILLLLFFFIIIIIIIIILSDVIIKHMI